MDHDDEYIVAKLWGGIVTAETIKVEPSPSFVPPVMNLDDIKPEPPRYIVVTLIEDLEYGIRDTHKGEVIKKVPLDIEDAEEYCKIMNETHAPRGMSYPPSGGIIKVEPKKPRRSPLDFLWYGFKVFADDFVDAIMKLTGLPRSAAEAAVIFWFSFLSLMLPFALDGLLR